MLSEWLSLLFFTKNIAFEIFFTEFPCKPRVDSCLKLVPDSRKIQSVAENLE